MHVSSSDRFHGRNYYRQVVDFSDTAMRFGEPHRDRPKSILPKTIAPFRWIKAILIRRWNREELEIHLRRLSDTELSDLGIRRGEIEAAVKAAFPTPPFVERSRGDGPAESAVAGERESQSIPLTGTLGGFQSRCGAFNHLDISAEMRGLDGFAIAAAQARATFFAESVRTVGKALSWPFRVLLAVVDHSRR